jgi:excisionase family DNA binding protein
MQETMLFKVNEVAERLGVHPRTVKDWIRAGELEAFRLHEASHGVRVAESDLLAFIESRRAL